MLVTRRKQGGTASTDLILSAHIGGNADVFPDVLRLHVAPGSRIADVTYGRGVFWKNITGYDVVASDVKTGTDCRDLPYPDAEFDAVVLDPPYMEGMFRHDTANLAGSGTHGAFRAAYSDGTVTTAGPKYHDAVLDLYFRAGREAHRVLRSRGVLIVKCQDEVSAGRQRLTHIELVNEYAVTGFRAVDLFVVVRRKSSGRLADHQAAARPEEPLVLPGVQKGTGVIPVRSKCPECGGNLFRIERGRIVFGIECACGWKPRRARRAGA